MWNVARHTADNCRVTGTCNSRNALSAQRRELPMVEIDADYVFEGDAS